MTDDLTRLAERVAALTGPDREVDAEIAVIVLGYRRDGTSLWHKGEHYSIREPDYYDLAGQLCELPAYSDSLDAAMQLVPEGLSIECMGYDQTATPPWYAQLARLTDSHSQPCRSAHSLALALLAAALHAHAQGETK